MARLYGAPQLRALFRGWVSFAVDWQDRTCQQPLAVGKFCDLETETARAPVCRTILGVKWRSKGRTDVKDDPNDIPMVYLLHVLLAIGGIVAVAAIVVIRML